MDQDEKQYKVMEGILNKINQKYVALSEPISKRNNALTKQVIEPIVDKMRTKNVLFASMYQRQFYGGSYYDGLKISEPSEYDLDCLLCLPKIIEPTVEASDKPGFVKIFLKQLKTMENRDEKHRYEGLSKLVDEENYLSSIKVLAWMESVINLAINDFPKSDNQAVIPVIIDDHPSDVLAKLHKSGPALTLKLKGEFDGNSFDIYVDLVTCFTFFAHQWPEKDYKKNTSKTKNSFFVVPKSPSLTEDTYWRLSFQEQERELLGDWKFLKPTIKLLKKLRDFQNHKKIASYYIKTIFLLEINNMNSEIWGKSQSYVFMIMLEKYADYIKEGNIPYYWNPNHNLLSNVKEATYLSIANQLKNIIQDVKRTLTTDPFTIAKYLLTPEEVETLKTEVILGKKYLKLISTASSPEEPKTKVAVPNVELSSSKMSSNASSVWSSFEEINMAEAKGEAPPSPVTIRRLLVKMEEKNEAILKMTAETQQLCQSVVADNKKTITICQMLVEKVDVLEKMLGCLLKENEGLRTKKKPTPEGHLLAEINRLGLSASGIGSLLP